MVLYVKKLVSLNPTKYKFISWQKAKDGYNQYCISWFKWALTRITDKGYIKKDFSRIKNFENWLKNEI